MVQALLGLLFPLWALLPRATELGVVSFTQVAGVGWQATIRPPYEAGRGVNAWSGQARRMGQALRAALQEANAHPKFGYWETIFAPKLGTKEFDDE